MQKPKNPIGYTVDELCRILGCEAGDVNDAIRCKTVGVDRETGEALIYYVLDEPLGRSNPLSHLFTVVFETPSAAAISRWLAPGCSLA